jgi:catechol 2,3-dioxygenase-like lactoylglutathione lyase family enzyme
MSVTALDHVNIVARDLAASVRFYVEVLGLTRRDPPQPVPPEHTQWLCDPAGRAVVHLGSASHPRNADREIGGSTRGLDHVAFSCTGYDATIERLEALGVEYRSGGLPGLPFRQIFVTDPSGVALELNFAGP